MAFATLSTETKGRIVERLLDIEATISKMEKTIPHDDLPSEYDNLIRRRVAGRALLNQTSDR
jgi:hypothetical protein